MKNQNTIIQETKIKSHPAFRLDPIALVWRKRAVLAIAITILLLIIVSIISIFSGGYGKTLSETIEIIKGGGTKIDRLVIVEKRIPRVFMALLAGFALGLGGAITQSVARNALASPDILGITTGASAVAITMIVGLKFYGLAQYSEQVEQFFNIVGRPMAAMMGAFITAFIIWILAFKKGVETFRLVLVGIGVSTFLGAYMDVLLMGARIDDLMRVMRWSTGALDLADWDSLIMLTISCLFFVPLIGWLSFKLNATNLGKDTAVALGLNWHQTQMLLWGAALILSASCVAAAGPIGFIAFVAPQIGMRLIRSATQPLLLSALVGALIVSAADLLGRVYLKLPVGILTSLLGAPVFMYLLLKINRRSDI